MCTLEASTIAWNKVLSVETRTAPGFMPGASFQAPVAMISPIAYHQKPILSTFDALWSHVENQKAMPNPTRFAAAIIMIMPAHKIETGRAFTFDHSPNASPTSPPHNT